MESCNLAKRLLHDLELEFDGDLKVGALEHNQRYVECVSKTLDEILEEEEGCYCGCVVCGPAEHA